MIVPIVPGSVVLTVPCGRDECEGGDALPSVCGSYVPCGCDVGCFVPDHCRACLHALECHEEGAEHG